MFGIKKKIWDEYKLQQAAVETAGMKGLDLIKKGIVLRTIRHDLKVKPTVIFRPLNEAQANRIILNTQKRTGVKDTMTPQAIAELNTIGIAIDNCEVGVASLVQGDEYSALNNDLAELRLQTKKDKKIKEMKKLSYSINTLLLSVLYFRDQLKIAPSMKFNLAKLKETFDEEMLRQLEEM